MYCREKTRCYLLSKGGVHIALLCTKIEYNIVKILFYQTIASQHPAYSGII